MSSMVGVVAATSVVIAVPQRVGLDFAAYPSRRAEWAVLQRQLARADTRGVTWKSALTWVLSALPEGGALPAKDWAQRHRAILWILWAHVAGLLAFGLFRG